VILESLIEDDRLITLDCAKATIRKGETIEIADEYYYDAEVQNAIKLGFVKLVGDPPPPPPEKDPEKKGVVELTNVSRTRLAFDCIQGSVGAGETIEVPIPMLVHKEIANALDWGYLENPDEPRAKQPGTSPDPVKFDEISIDESEEGSGDPVFDELQLTTTEDDPEEEKPAETEPAAEEPAPAAKKQKKVKKTKKPKKVNKKGKVKRAGGAAAAVAGSEDGILDVSGPEDIALDTSRDSLETTEESKVHEAASKPLSPPVEPEPKKKTPRKKRTAKTSSTMKIEKKAPEAPPPKKEEPDSGDGDVAFHDIFGEENGT
jgi:hypothetical protein